MKFKNNKLIEITAEQKRMILYIKKEGTCWADSVKLVSEYLSNKFNIDNKDIANKVLNACYYEYKYCKVVE